MTLLPKLAFIKEWDSQIKAIGLIRTFPYLNELNIELNTDDRYEYCNKI